MDKGTKQYYRCPVGEEFEDTKESINQRGKDKTIQWTNERRSTNKQRSTKHTYKTQDQVTRTQLKRGSNHLTILRTNKIRGTILKIV